MTEKAIVSCALTGAVTAKQLCPAILRALLARDQLGRDHPIDDPGDGRVRRGHLLGQLGEREIAHRLQELEDVELRRRDAMTRALLLGEATALGLEVDRGLDDAVDLGFFLFGS